MTILRKSHGPDSTLVSAARPSGQTPDAVTAVPALQSGKDVTARKAMEALAAMNPNALVQHMEADCPTFAGGVGQLSRSMDIGGLRYDFGPIGVCAMRDVESLAVKFDKIVSIGAREDYPEGFLGSHPKVLVCEFDDTGTEFEPVSENAATEDHVRQILDFVKPGERVLFHCMGGVSRSPAAALLAAIHLGAPLESAIAALDPNFVDPNPHLLACGERVLGLPEGSLVRKVRAQVG